MAVEIVSVGVEVPNPGCGFGSFRKGSVEVSGLTQDFWVGGNWVPVNQNLGGFPTLWWADGHRVVPGGTGSRWRATPEASPEVSGPRSYHQRKDDRSSHVPVVKQKLHLSERVLGPKVGDLEKIIVGQPCDYVAELQMFYPLVQLIKSVSIYALAAKDNNLIHSHYRRLRILLAKKISHKYKQNNFWRLRPLPAHINDRQPQWQGSKYSSFSRPDRPVLVNRSLANLQPSQWRTSPIKPLLALLIVIGLSLAIGSPAAALQGWPLGKKTLERKQASLPIPISAPGGGLQEVAPPGGVQMLKDQLAKHDPQLTLKSPEDGSVLTTGDWDLVLEVKDWPLVNDPELGLGAHLVVQIDDDQPLRVFQAEDGLVRIPMKGVRPGSHRFSAYCAFPWGEAVHAAKASLQWRLHQFQAMEGTQPSQEAPWLVSVSPSQLQFREPFLLDWLIWNAPLQNLRDGDGRWRMRVTINGDSFLMDRQEALWMKGLPSGTATVQLELLDGLGEPIDPVFNNQLRLINGAVSDQKAPIWMQPRLNAIQLARLLGETPYQEPATESENSSQLEATTTNITTPNIPTVNIPTSNIPANLETNVKIPRAESDPKETPSRTSSSEEALKDGPLPSQSEATNSKSAAPNNEQKQAVTTTNTTQPDQQDEVEQKPGESMDLNELESAEDAALDQLTTTSLEKSAGPPQNIVGTQQPS